MNRKLIQGTDCWTLYYAISPHSPRLLLTGDTATGKTHAVCTPRNDSHQIYSICVTDDMPATELRGCYMPSETGFSWVDGVGIRAWRTPGECSLIIDEIDHGSGDVESMLFALVDSPASARLTLPTGETVKPEPGVQIIATTNAPFESLSAGIRSRFPVHIVIDKPNPHAIAALPSDIQEAARNGATETAERRIDLRTWFEFARLREQVTPEIAALACFGPRATDILGAIELAGA